MNDGLSAIGNRYIKAMEKVTDAYRKQISSPSPTPKPVQAHPDSSVNSGLPSFVLQEYKRRLL